MSLATVRQHIDRFLRNAGPHAAAAAVLIGVPVFVHRDVLRHPSALLLSGYGTGGYFAWVFWWWATAIRQHWPLLECPLLMYPTGVPMFFHAPVSEVPAVLLQLITTPYAATNLLLIASFSLAGLAAYPLYLRVGRNPWAALCGAFSFAFSAFMLVEHWHGHVIEKNIFFDPLFVLAAWRFLDKPDGWSEAYLALAAAGLVLCGPYVVFSFGFVFIGLALLYDLARGARHVRDPRLLRPWLAIGAGCGALAFAVYWPIVLHGGHWLGGAAFFNVPLAALIDPPFWNRSAFWQHLSIRDAVNPFPERTMGYVGVGPLLATLGAIWLVVRRKAKLGFWIWIVIGGLVLVLGPTLSWNHGRNTAIPLPYAIFRHMPLLSSFRVSGRIMATVTLATGALVAAVLARLLEGRRARWGALTAAVYVGFAFWEFDLGLIGTRVAPTEAGPCYAPIIADGTGRAVLELPNSYTEDGDLVFFNQYYMLLETRHRHPIVLGFPGRYLREQLAFTDETDVVHELTHPWLFLDLERNPSLASRARYLEENGQRVLAEKGIGWIVYHPAFPVYGDQTQAALDRWLGRLLGAPAVVDGQGNRLYAVPAESDQRSDHRGVKFQAGKGGRPS